MDEIVYMSVRLACAAYLLYKVWGQKKKVRGICDLLYTPVKKKDPEVLPAAQPDESDVMGGTRFVYLDENAGQVAAPYMSQPLETGTDYIGEEEDISEQEVECNLPLEEMKMLKEEQEELDEAAPEVDSISQAVTPADLDNVGNVLFRLDGADKDEVKSRRAAVTLHTIRETDLFEVFSSQVENKSIIEDLMGKYLDEEGNALPVRKGKETRQTGNDWRSLI